MLASEAEALSERLAASRFYVAFVGQFKRGKSTLVNALLGEDLLPAGVVPVTTIVTVVRHGSQREARVRIGGEWREIDPSRIAEYATELQNPSNTKRVEALELFHPSPLLAGGMCFVDTPGLGSVFSAASEATRAFVPNIDVAVAVLGGDPPLSADEAELIESVAREVNELVFVLNKADRLPPSDRAEARTFMARILEERLGRPIAPILEVSAWEHLAGKVSGGDWGRLVDRLGALAHDAGAELVAAGERRALARLGERLLRELHEREQALTRPIADSELRIAELRRCAASAERSLSDLTHLFAGEQERLAATFAERREAFLADSMPKARAELLERLQNFAGAPRSILRGKGIESAQEVFRAWVERWRRQEQPFAEDLYRRAAQRFVDLANDFLTRLAESGEQSLAALPRALDAETGFRVRSELFYTQMMTLTTRSPLAWLIDRFRSRRSLCRSVERDSGEYLDRLLAANSARVRSGFDERVLESRRRLEAQVRRHLQEIYTVAERALESARKRRASGEAEVAAELARIQVLRERVDEIRAEQAWTPDSGAEVP